MVARDSQNRQEPSNRKLEAIRSELADAGIKVEFLLRYGEFEDIEIGLRSTLLYSHINLIRNVFLSIDLPNASVWVEPKSGIDESSLLSMTDRSREYLSLFDLKLSSFAITSEALLPPIYAMLSTIRILSPVQPIDLEKEIKSRGFTVPSSDWLSRKLDIMRKEGRVVRLSNGAIVLTLKSLQQLGTSKDSTSPDVRRALALARGRR